LFFAVFGPATITAISDNDAAGVATYSLAGSQFGYSILFILLFVTILLAVTQEMGVRSAVVTKKGLGDLIRERYGLKIAVFVFLGLFIANMGSIIANFAALKATSQLFNFPTIPFLISVVFLSFLFIAKGNYEINQKIFLVGILLYFAYIFSAMKANPDWSAALTNLVWPKDVKFSSEFVFAAIAVLGTTITPWGQFFIQSYVNDKKISLESLKLAQIETYFGAFLTDFFSFFMIVATAATLFANQITLVSGEEAALAIKPFAGEFAGTLFGIGLLNAGIMGIIIIALSTAYAFSEFFGYEGSLDSPFERGKLFYGIFLFQLILAMVIILLPNISLFQIVFYTQSLNALILPVILFFLLKITNSKQLMGKYTNSKWYNYFSIFSTILIIGASIFTVVSAFL
jgi:NRAMP (natural resistance-associated macrophage protein)-like metal ion transporter